MSGGLAYLRRLGRHLWLDERASRRFLSDAAAARLRRRIEASEASHRGEIRLCVEASLPLRWLWPPPDEAAMAQRVRQRALDWFARLRVWDTEDNTGVLIYLLLAERAIEIVADRGLARYVAPGDWDVALQALRQRLQRGPAEDALAQAIDTVDAWLRACAPLRATRPKLNELPDAVVRV